MGVHRGAYRAVGLGLSVAASLSLMSGPVAGDGGCRWERPPRPDSELDIPDPDDFLVPLEDGSFLLPNETVEFNGHTVELPLLVDLMMIAEEKGIGIEEAIFRYGWHNEFAAVAAELEAAYPDRFAGAAIVNDGCGAWIAFSGPVPARAATLVEALPVPVELIGQRGFSQEELVTAMEEVYFSIYEHPDIVNASGSTDQETGVITIAAQPAASIPADPWGALGGRLMPPPPANPAFAIELTLVDDLESHPSRTCRC